MSKQGNGLGLGSVLAIVFTVLKLCGVINWSWWWVLLPVWGPFTLILLLLFIGVTCKVLADLK